MAGHELTTEKTCTTCHVTYPATTKYFYADKTGKWGVGSRCKTCGRIYNALPLQRAARKRYRESEVGQKARVREAKSPAAQKRYARYAKTAKAKKVRTRYRKSEKGKIVGCLSAHRRRARKLATLSTLTSQQWTAIKVHYQQRCVYCGKKSTKLTMDHIVPFFHGGTHTYDNVVPACGSCNARKRIGPPLIPVQPLLLVAI